MRTIIVSLAWLVSLVAIAACAVGITPDTQSDGGDGSTDSGPSEKDAKTADASEVKDGASATECAGYAAPSEAAACKCGSGKTCDANNCYGGYYCSLETNKCVPKPASCP